jgi:hypothetical protein
MLCDETSKSNVKWSGEWIEVKWSEVKWNGGLVWNACISIDFSYAIRMEVTLFILMYIFSFLFVNILRTTATVWNPNSS